jgi:hypothetical protein
MNAFEKYAAKQFLVEKLAGFATAQSYRAGKGFVDAAMNARTPRGLEKLMRSIKKLDPEARKGVFSTIRAGRADGRGIAPKNLIELEKKWKSSHGGIV